MTTFRRSISVILTLLAAAVAQAATATTEQSEFFESKIRPLLEAKCGVCHGDQTKMAGLILTTAEGFANGIGGVPLVDPNNPGASRLLEAISYQGKIKMPPTGKLTDEEISSFTTWVKGGAPWPNAQPVTTTTKKSAPNCV